MTLQWRERLVVGAWSAAIAALMALVLGLVVITPVDATGATHAASITIPEQSARYRLALEREAGARFGLDAPTARLAAQIHQESRWRANAASRYADGLAQFTPPTAAWMSHLCPDAGPVDVWDPYWSIRAMACYDAYLYAQVAGASECDRWAFALSAYNGGLRWVNRDKKRASATGADPARWFGQTELHTTRDQWARVENRSYVRRILLIAEPAYIAAGWPGVAVCA